MALRNCSKDVREEVRIYIILVKGYMLIKHVSIEGCYWSQGTNVLVIGFSAFLSMKKRKKLGS